jgi:glycosyltransferase involved in cell wall biosynthesis
MSKPKILIWCDAPVINTGFGVVAKNLFSELHKHCEVEIVGINYFGLQKYDQSQWFIYPVQKNDLLGMEPLTYAIGTNQYDIIILFQDIFHISQLLPSLKESAKNSKIISYFPIDGGPLYKEWRNVFSLSDKAITYTKYALDTIKESYPEIDIKKIDYLYHGVESAFKKLSRQQIKQAKREFQWADRFAAVNINRYQPRKNIPAMLRVWSLFSKGYKLCSCGNAYPKNLNFCDANRCGPEEVIKETEGKKDVSLYLHMRPVEKANGPGKSNSLASLMEQNGFNQNDLDDGLLYVQKQNMYARPFSVDDMNKIYNAADINLSTSFGEGVGLSLIESAASGTTSIAPKNSAIIEMLEGHGVLVDNVANGIFTQPFDNSFRRPNVNTLLYVEALESQYLAWQNNNRKKIINEKAIEAVQSKFRWDDKREFIQQTIKSLL